jgi:hypothetical protein
MPAVLVRARRQFHRPRAFGPWTKTPPFVAGVASFSLSGPAGIIVTSTAHSGGANPVTLQWQRNSNGGSYANLSNGGGVGGVDTLTLSDGSAVAGTLYGYRLVWTDAASQTLTSNAVTAQVYLGGALSSGGVGARGMLTGGRL